MKKFFKAILSILKVLFGGKLDEYIHEHVQPAIELIQKLKMVIDSDAVDIITALIPGDADDKLVAKMRKNLALALNLLLPDLSNSHSNEDVEAQLQAFSMLIKTQTPEMQKAIWHKLASVYAKVSGGQTEVKGFSVDLLTQVQYAKMKMGEIEYDKLPPLQTKDLKDQEDYA